MSVNFNGVQVQDRKSGLKVRSMIGTGILAVALIMSTAGCASTPAADPQVVAPQGLIETLPMQSTTPSTATSSAPSSGSSTSSTPPPAVDSAALAAAAAAVDSERLIAEQAAQAAAAAAAAEANRVAAEAAAAAQAETDRLATEAASAAQAAADRVAAEAAAAAQAQADRAAQEAAQRLVVADPAPSVFYANCTAARAAGAAPVMRGEPGYSSKLDRDGDGIGCES